MIQPLFDFDLKRVSREHYITGKAAINFPDPGSTTGGWHFLSYFDRESGVAKVSLAGIHYPDTAGFFGSLGVMDATEPLAQRGWSVEGRRLYMADHYRVAADMIARWALSEYNHCSVEIDDWFPSRAERQRLLEIIDTGRSKLSEVGQPMAKRRFSRTGSSSTCPAGDGCRAPSHFVSRPCRASIHHACVLRLPQQQISAPPR